MTFVRTVLGDISPDELGVTYAHEHLVIDGGGPVEVSPDFLLADVDRMVSEVDSACAAGLRAAIDMMPIACGRNPHKLAELSRRTGIHLVAATGLHHERFYDPSHWSRRATWQQLADRFVADLMEGIDEHDDRGPIVERTTIRAGVVKVAGSEGGPSRRDIPAFEAAAAANHRTGVPIHTHCEAGTGALEQVELLLASDVVPRVVSLSHVDKVVDRGYHRAILESGAYVVYDQGFRWGDQPNGTLRLLEWAAEDGHLDRVMLGMDAARQGYHPTYGGGPGLSWLLSDFAAEMEARGLDADARHAMFVENPATAFAFGTRQDR
jgi:5-phospho-D-xylono-1,4-lactonase